MARRPRVFTWSDGFHRYFVAETSRAKALAAWGFDRDLFREGAASEINEGPGHDAALARPGEVIEEVAGDIRELAAAAPEKPKPKSSGKALATARKRLAEMEVKLAALDADHQAAEADFAAREAALARERETADRRHAEARATLRERLGEARAAVKAAAG